MKRIEENYFWGNRVRKIERGARRSGGKPEGGGGGEKLREGAGEARVGGEGDGGPGGEAGAVTGGEGGDGQGGGREGDGAEGEGGALSADEDAWVQRPGDDPPVSPEGEGRPCHHAACQLASVCLITPFFELVSQGLRGRSTLACRWVAHLHCGGSPRGAAWTVHGADGM